MYREWNDVGFVGLGMYSEWKNVCVRVEMYRNGRK
jgi:hypothetical protein